MQEQSHLLINYYAPKNLVKTIPVMTEPPTVFKLDLT